MGVDAHDWKTEIVKDKLDRGVKFTVVSFCKCGAMLFEPVDNCEVRRLNKESIFNRGK